MPRNPENPWPQREPRRARARPPAEGVQEALEETVIRTRRAVRAGHDVVYAAEVETTRFSLDPENPEFVTESHSGGAQAACGCLIEGGLKPRFFRDGITMVCQNHYYFCAVCGLELLPLELVFVEKRVYCKKHGEEAIDEILWVERRQPGSFEKATVAHLGIQKRQLRGERWRRAFNRLLGREERLLE